MVSISNTKISVLKYGHSEVPFKMIKVPSWKVPVKVIDDQTFLYLQNLPKRKIKNIIFWKWSVFEGFQSQEKQRTYAFQCVAKNTQGWLIFGLHIWFTVRFGLNLPKDDCQVSYIFVWINLSGCFTGKFLPKFDLLRGFKLGRCNPSKHTNWKEEWQWMFSHSQEDIESRVELWKLGKPWWRGLKRSHHILWRRLGRHVNIWLASQFMGPFCVWNTEREHGRRKNWALCRWAWLGGANSLKGQVCRCVLKIKEKEAGSFVSVKHGKRAWQTKELVRKEPYA